jgi:hypothetical protein
LEDKGLASAKQVAGAKQQCLQATHSAPRKTLISQRIKSTQHLGSQGEIEEGG